MITMTKWVAAGSSMTGPLKVAKDILNVGFRPNMGKVPAPFPTSPILAMEDPQPASRQVEPCIDA